MSRRNAIIAPIAFLVGLAAAVLWYREPTAPLTREGLDAARQRWESAGVEDYTIRYRMNRDLYDVKVVGGIVVQATVDGTQPRGGSLGSYSVDGLFRLLELELENLNDPRGPYASQRESMVVRVRFNEELGYPERYVRSAGGMGAGAAIEVIEFRRSESQAAPS